MATVNFPSSLCKFEEKFWSKFLWSTRKIREIISKIRRKFWRIFEKIWKKFWRIFEKIWKKFWKNSNEIFEKSLSKFRILSLLIFMPLYNIACNTKFEFFLFLQNFFTRSGQVLTVFLQQLRKSENGNATIEIYDGFSASENLLAVVNILNNTRTQSVTTTSNNLYIKFIADARTEVFAVIKIVSSYSKYPWHKTNFLGNLSENFQNFLETLRKLS